ncbi:hypothetical protein [Algivirga pacifica]|uniref:Helix-hairpin-helix domain-containing protein n=1 Tax=Algivirga pacifica TaxID=1162670 RepID=A0ABP9DB42_9BACT
MLLKGCLLLRFIGFSGLLLWMNTGYAQVLAEEVLQGQWLNNEQSVEMMMELLEDPIDLNQTKGEILRELGWITLTQQKALQQHIEQYGVLLSVYELQAVQGWDLETVKRVAPYISTSKESLRQHWKEKWRQLQSMQHELQWRWGRSWDKEEESSESFLGSLDRMAFRLKGRKAGQCSYGVSMEKDAGEAVDKGPDFWSANVTVHKVGSLKTLTLGDYRLQLGQGLLSGASYFIGKGMESVLGLQQYSRGIRPYHSMSETGFLRGVAAAFQWGNCRVLPFVSSRRKDAVIIDGQVVSMPSAGLHRTLKELAYKDRLMERYAGVYTDWRWRDILKIGITTANLAYSLPIQSSGSKGVIRFTGRKSQQYALDFHLDCFGIQSFGEVARVGAGNAVLLGGQWGLGKKLALSWVYRYYAKNFHVVYGSAFGTGATPSNEKGLYTGISIKLSKYCQLTSYMDLFSRPWLRYGVYKPQYFSDFSLGIRNRKKRFWTYQCRYRWQQKEAVVDQYGQRGYQPFFKHSIKADIEWFPLKNCKVRMLSRYSYTVYPDRYQESKEGVALGVRIDWTYKMFKASADYVFFDTDDYENRLYLYQKGVRYSNRYTALYGEGYKWNYVFSYKWRSWLSMYLQGNYWIYGRMIKVNTASNRFIFSKKLDLNAQLICTF